MAGLRALKLLVGVLSALLLAGFVVLVMGVAGLIGTGRDRETGPLAGRIDLPAGARIVGLAATADRVILQVGMPAGDDQLYIMDPVSGSLTARIAMVPGAGATASPPTEGEAP